MTKKLRLPMLNDYLFGLVEEMFPEIEVQGEEYSKLICKGMSVLQVAELTEVVYKRFPQMIVDGKVANETYLEFQMAKNSLVLEVVTTMYVED